MITGFLPFFTAFRALLILILAGLCACDRTPEVPEDLKLAPFSAQVDTLLPGLLEDFGIEGASIAVMEEGEITLLKGYGFANSVKNAPLTEDHIFNIASISKAVTAWGVMRLFEEGKIDLDSPVNHYLKRWKVKDGTGPAEKVTIRRLLSHTAGIGMPSTPGFRWPMEVPGIVEILSGNYRESTYARTGTGAEVIYLPGQEFHYSGGGFIILQLLIEDLTGQNFADYMKTHVLTPLGMENSQFGWDENLSKRMATPYLRTGNEEDVFRAPGLAASSLHSSARDLAQWMLAGTNSNRGLRNRVISDQSLGLMYGPLVQTNLGNGELKEMGLAYFLEMGEGTLAVSHSGGNAGWRARVLFSPDKGQGFLVLTNSDDGGKLVEALSCLWAAGQAGLEVAKNC